MQYLISKQGTSSQQNTNTRPLYLCLFALLLWLCVKSVTPSPRVSHAHVAVLCSTAVSHVTHTRTFLQQQVRIFPVPNHPTQVPLVRLPPQALSQQSHCYCCESARIWTIKHRCILQYNNITLSFVKICQLIKTLNAGYGPSHWSRTY